MWSLPRLVSSSTVYDYIYIYNANTSTWVFEVRKGAEETNTCE